MKHPLTVVSLSFGLLLAVASPALPQVYQNSRYGYAGNSSSLLNQVRSDVNRAASAARLDGHEREHVDKVMQNLGEFEDRWSQGNFDNGRLDRAIESLNHLANADRVRSRDRGLLSRDLAALRDFRASRGSYGNSSQGGYNGGYSGDYRQQPGYPQQLGYRDDGRYQNGRQGYGGNSGSLIGRVQSDLNQAASNARLDGHDREHFDQAIRKLDEFQARWAQGNFDNGRLDSAIDNMNHLVNADRVHPQDRNILGQDLAALRQFRSSRGNY